MAVKKKFTDSIPVQLTPAMRARVKAVADHPAAEVSMAQVIRDCVEVALPGFELNLQIRTIDSEGEFVTIDAADLQEPEAPKKEDRSVGCYGGPPKPQA